MKIWKYKGELELLEEIVIEKCIGKKGIKGLGDNNNKFVVYNSVNEI